MEKGADLMLKLENDSIITLNNEEDAVAEYWSLNLGKPLLSILILKQDILFQMKYILC